MIELLEHQDGVYFSLPDKDYHRDPALGSTDLRNLLVSPATYWWRSKWSPLYRDKDTPARQWGRMFHALVLEGEGAFRARYMRGPCKDDYGDGLMVTADDLKAWLQKRGYATSGTKGELIKRVLGVDANAPIWDVINERAEALADGRTVVAFDTYDEINLASRLITKNPDLKKSFSGGMPEVSVFWTVDGVRFKCRFDYLKIKAVTDLKSFSNQRDKPLIKAIAHDQVAGHRYDIQASHYLLGRHELARLVGEGRVFGDHDPEWLAKVAANPEPQFAWVFTEVPNGAVSVAVVFQQGSHTHSGALSDIAKATAEFKRCREVFGMRSIWVHTIPTIVLDDSDMPSWLGVGTGYTP